MGLAIGDALGFPFEGKAREELKHINLSCYHAGLFPPGTWSDDTSLTFITIESLRRCQGLNLADLAQSFLRWLKEGYLTPFGQAIGVGRATKEALLRIEKGVLPEKAGGTDERDNGNGSLMRILPVVLWYRREPELVMLEKVHLASSITHAHPRAKIACGLYALLCRGLIETDFDKALGYALDFGRKFYQKAPFSAELRYFEPLFDGSLFTWPQEKISTSGYVVHTLLAACWILKRTKSYHEAVTLAVRLGGDTDTTAAVVGGAAGLCYGYESLPANLLNELVKGEMLKNIAWVFALEAM